MSAAANSTVTQEWGRVAVLMGGQSAERTISLASGQAVLSVLQRRGIDAVALDVGPDIVNDLLASQADRVFIALHGRGGEDGVMQGCLQTLGLPYSGSGVMASALAMDKLRSKQIWASVGLPTPAYLMLDAIGGRALDAAAIIERLGLPLAVKPSREGSSLGISKVNEASALLPAIERAFGYDDEVLVEHWVQGAEYTVAIVGDRALPVIRLETDREFYDYDAKYVDTGTAFLCPCGLDDARESACQRLAMEAYQALGCRGWGRVDLMLDASGQPWLIEANTVPGLTDHSLVPMAARAAGIEFDALVMQILASSHGSLPAPVPALQGGG